MPKRQQARGRNRTGSKTSIWLALAVALGLHAILLLLPMSRQIPQSASSPAQIELQLTTFSPQQPAPQVPEPPTEPDPEIVPPEAIAEAEEMIAEVKPEIIQAEFPPDPLMDAQPNEFADLSESERSRITSSILSAQFITRESEADKIFGKPLELPGSDVRKEFHFPTRPNMISMLDQPMPDLPFAYTPGLVRFAYDPGMRGDLQRFWDVITPEFGWRTDNGTEVRCVWVLVIVGCGWK